MKALIHIFLIPAFLLSLLIEPNYIFHYTSLALALIACLYISKDINSKALNIFALFYYGLALLNISNYRGLIDERTMFVFALFIGAFAITHTIYSRTTQQSSATTLKSIIKIKNASLLKLIAILHISISYVALAFVIAKSGNIFLNQDLRFGIPAWTGYIIRSTLPLIPLIYFLKTSNTKKALLSLIIIAPSIFIGARGTAISFIASYAIVALYFKNQAPPNTHLPLKNSKKKPRVLIALFGALAFAVISSGFYIRRYNSSTWSSASELVHQYFFTDNPLIYILMPFYLAFRETVGLSAKIINTPNISSNSLFFSDFYTLLPGSYEAAGKLFGDIIGRVGDGGLTPGIVGALYIDYGAYGISAMVGLSFASAYLYKAARLNPVLIPTYSVFILQLIHLFHRGFPKPEYLTFLIITLIYTLFLKRAKDAQGTPRTVSVPPQHQRLIHKNKSTPQMAATFIH